ncbi:MmgE/PrpD family protein [Hyphomonas johnsonii]|uniref:Propionate catabolism protein n=1 Tax=Hyphomonas johnsonii MHS-2 TaxID=1280950 RepID=A0A059FUB1_9PROT|nr:MmgE/PrpD family protein [Hyphomonas johnsonii]KCZ94269.1 propionate catabolism protein [Hyphomonas johnsonii MHS-2]
MTAPDIDRDGPTLAERQARWISTLTYDAIPKDVRERARLLLLDFMGVARRGATLPQAALARALFADMGGNEQSSVIGGGSKTSAAYAALANGVSGHAFEYDDAHWNCGHPGVCVIPAVLALAEREGASGKEILTAIVAGYQAMVYAMGPINRITLDIGWHGTKVGGVFGAAAASAKLLGLSEAEIAQALAIAGSEASGTMEYDQSGGEVKRFHAGIPARAGVESAILAKAGLTGPLTIFEGLRGIHRLFSERSEVDVEAYWDGSWHIMNTFVKLYPMVGTTHAALDALGTILDRQQARMGEIIAIEVGLVDWALPHGAAIVHPHDMLSAQFSLAFACALRVLRGQVAFLDLADPEIRSDPEINALADKVTPVAMQVPDGADPLFGHVTVRFADGREDSELQIAPRGHPANPAGIEDVRCKFREVLSGLLDDAAIEQVIVAAENIEETGDAGMLVRMMG